MHGLSSSVLLLSVCFLGACATRAAHNAPHVSAAHEGSPSIAGAWLVEQVAGLPVNQRDARQPIRLEFAPEAESSNRGQISGFFGVNRASGTYALEGESLAIGSLAMTRMAGPPEANRVEADIADAIARVQKVRLTHRTLALLDSAGNELLRLNADR